jgi:hypothetical protein
VKRISNNKAWDLATDAGKCPPYEGYALDLGEGKVLLQKSHQYFLIEFPVTDGQIAKFEEENAEFIKSLPEPDVEKFLSLIRSRRVA